MNLTSLLKLRFFVTRLCSIYSRNGDSVCIKSAKKKITKPELQDPLLNLHQLRFLIEAIKKLSERGLKIDEQLTVILDVKEL